MRNDPIRRRSRVCTGNRVRAECFLKVRALSVGPRRAPAAAPWPIINQPGPASGSSASVRVGKVRSGWERRRKRHALVDAEGRGLVLETRRASKIAMVADRLCGFRAASSRSSNGSSPTADMSGEKVTTATLIAVEIVRKNPDRIGFAVNPRRWVVERFFA